MITVETTDGATFDIDAGTGWHVDEDGYLHVKGAPGTGNLATFHCNVWHSALRVDDDLPVAVK